MSSVLKMLIIEDVPADAEMTLRELRRSGLDIDYRRVQTATELRREDIDVEPDIVLSHFARPKYHAISWKGPDVAKNYQDKLALLKEIMTEVHAYLGTKPDGKRRDAVLRLGEQIVALMQSKFAGMWSKAANWETMFA